jgi:hypothetical protein
MSKDDTGLAAFIGLGAPLVYLAGLALFLLLRDVLLPAWARREATLSHHGLPLALALLMGADLLQTVYYASARLFPGMLADPWHAWPVLIALRALVLSGSLVALATYAAIAGWRTRWPQLVMIALTLWAAAFVALMLVV